ncbi:MAG: hypothetical protein KBD04_03885 [Proteobacteria bacterium]|nr:hypothetical protein [Pseudomonadota bacterium]
MITTMYAWLISAMLSVGLLMLWKKIGIRDLPNQRSAHVMVTPTAAGICVSFIFIMFSFFSKIGVVSLDGLPLPSIFGFIILTLVGFMDDWKELNYKARLLSHTLAVGLVLAQQTLSFPEYFLWLLIGVGLINACNFLDGLNGLLASQWLLTMGFLLSAFAPCNSVFWVLWGAILVYLFFNFPKAHIFIGDTGSTILGFAYFFIIFSLAPSQYGFPTIIFPHDTFVAFCLFPLGVAWCDVAFTLVKRFIDKRSIIASFGDYGFHHKAKFFNSHAIVTLTYLSINCLLTLLATLLLFDRGYISFVCCLYAVIQLLHWKIIHWLNKKYIA